MLNCKCILIIYRKVNSLERFAPTSHFKSSSSYSPKIGKAENHIGSLHTVSVASDPVLAKSCSSKVSKTLRNISSTNFKKNECGCMLSAGQHIKHHIIKLLSTRSHV
jgi:hypothetical protein